MSSKREATDLDTGFDVTRRIADRLHACRTARHLSLEALAARSGVSRSMISLIERGESSPTAVTLDRLAAGLNTTLASLLAPAADPQGRRAPVARLSDQPVWRDPASGYRRRSVSPPAASHPMQIVEVHFPPGRRVAFETGTRDLLVLQQIWMLEGTMEVSVGPQVHRLGAGDCLAMELTQPTMFHNPTRRTARYAVVLATEAARP